MDNQTVWQKKLWTEFGKQMLVSIGIFAALYLILYIIEEAVPSLAGVLLQWSDPAFVVGVPSSVIGVGYVLTIRNPKNYVGFYGGIVMALLLAWQFVLLREWSLMVLYIVVFVPFMIFSIITWRKKSLTSDDDALCPTWLSFKDQVVNLIFLIGIIALDSGLLTNFQAVIHADDLLQELMGGCMVASSILANFWMIYQKIDAWIWWVVYAVAGMIFYTMIGNAFSFVLFAVFLIVNTGAGIAWIRIRKQYIQ